VTKRSAMMSGMGGQGMQLAARTLAVAAGADGLGAMVFQRRLLGQRVSGRV
jgi:Pyruvate/2-oxoacid:ferredoxin oxidoreductase gamma subunit